MAVSWCHEWVQSIICGRPLSVDEKLTKILLRLQIFIWDQTVLHNYITLSSSIPWTNNLFLPPFNIWVSVDVHLFIIYYVLKRNRGNIGCPVPRHTVQRKVPALLTCTLGRGNNLLTPGKRKSQCQKSTSADDGLSSKNPYCGTVLFWVGCEQALLFGRVKRVSRERASERRSREGQRKGELATISHKISFVLRPDEGKYNWLKNDW